MTVSVACPHCKKRYRIKDESLGRTSRCKSCGEAFSLTQAAKDTRRSQREIDTGGASPQAARVASPEKLGRFEIRSILGAGAFGTVYAAWDPTLERDVALKVPHHGLLADKEKKQRFLQERKIAAGLRHPNIVPVFDSGVDGDTLYIAFALIEGQTLDQAITEVNSDFQRAAELLIQLAEALTYAHSNDIVHRDVKPSNIILDSNGVPLIADFGLATLQESGDRMTLDGSLVGTPAYMSKEQAEGKVASIGPPSDQYSLGVILYEMLSGERPFSGPIDMVISNIINVDPAPPSSHNAAIPPDLETICLKAMAKEPANRYVGVVPEERRGKTNMQQPDDNEASEKLCKANETKRKQLGCHEFAEDLQRWLDDRPILARRISRLERVSRWCRRNPVTAGLTGAVAALLLLVTLVSAVGYATTNAALADALVQRKKAKKKQEAAETQRTIAEKQTQAAELQRVIAETQTEETRREKERADAQTAEAVRQSQLAQRERNLAQEESRRAYQHYYVAQLNLAQSDWMASEIGHLLVRLDRTRPAQTGDRDLRGFEWYYWDRLCHQDANTLTGHTSDVNCVAVSPDGQLIISGSDRSHASDRSPIRLWDTVSGREVLGLTAEYEEVLSVAFDPMGTRVAAGTKAFKNIFVYDVATGKQLLSLRGHSGEVNSVAFSPDGMWLASASGDDMLSTSRNQAGEVRVWNTATGECVHVWKSHAGPVHSVTFTPDGKTIASGSGDGSVKLWDISTGNEIRTLKGLTGVECVAFSPDGKKLASADGHGNTITIWNPSTGEKLATLSGHTRSVVSVAFSPSGAHLASGSWDNTVKLWDTSAAATIKTFKGHTEILRSVVFSPDGKWIISGSRDNTLKLWNTSSRHIVGPAPAPVPLSVNTQTTSPGGRYRAFVSSNLHKRSEIQLTLAATGESLHILKGHHEGDVRAVAFSADGTRLASASIGGDQSVVLWDVLAGTELLRLRESALGVVFSPDGRQLATAGWGGHVRLWDATTGKELFKLVGHTNSVNCVAFDPDGVRLASGSADGTVKLWDPIIGQEVLSLVELGGRVRHVAFSDDRHRITASGISKSLTWDATPVTVTSAQ